MVQFNKIDGWRDCVWINGTHNLELPFAGRILISNVSKWGCFNADALFLKRITTYQNWTFYRWFHQRSLNLAWLENEQLYPHIQEIIRLIQSQDGAKGSIRFYSSGLAQIQLYDYDENLERFMRIYERGELNNPRLTA